MRIGALLLPHLALALTLASPVRAQDAAPVANEGEDIVSLNGAEAGSTGRIAVNAAAGNNNQQANVGVVALGASAIAIGSISQFTDAKAESPSAYKSAVIEDGAFADSSGMIAVNLTAGSANQQANLALFAIGIEGQVVADATLSQTRASTSPSGGPEGTPASEIATGIAPGAFAGASGLVQVSLVGGERNSSANSFVLTAPGGTEP